MSIRIIIVDDSASFRELIKNVVQRMDNVEVIGIASDGEQALKDVKTLNPDLVLLDIRMPGMDGIKTLEVLKRNYPHIKVIMITNHEMVEYRQVTHEKGADGFVLKKTLFRELAPLIESVCNN